MAGRGRPKKVVEDKPKEKLGRPSKGSLLEESEPDVETSELLDIVVNESFERPEKSAAEQVEDLDLKLDLPPDELVCADESEEDTDLEKAIANDYDHSIAISVDGEVLPGEPPPKKLVPFKDDDSGEEKSFEIDLAEALPTLEDIIRKDYSLKEAEIILDKAKDDQRAAALGDRAHYCVKSTTSKGYWKAGIFFTLKEQVIFADELSGQQNKDMREAQAVHLKIKYIGFPE